MRVPHSQYFVQIKIEQNSEKEMKLSFRLNLIFLDVLYGRDMRPEIYEKNMSEASDGKTSQE